MKYKGLLVVLAAGLLVASRTSAQELTIASFKNGYVSWNNVDSNLYYTVEHRPNLSETNLGWDGSYRTCQDIKSTNDIITVPVGMFYRVVGSASPMHAINETTYTRIIRLEGALDFGICFTGATKTATFTIYNDGECAMTVSDVRCPDGFSGNWSGKLLVGGSTNVTVTFAPVLAQVYNGTVVVTSDLTSGTNTIVCTGTGIVVPTPPAPRYVDLGDGTVIDNVTGLMWMKDAGKNMNWQSAESYCSNLVYAGYNDWRLPSVAQDGGVAELDTLFRVNGDPSGSWEGYAGTPFSVPYNTSLYWSSTSSKTWTDCAWTMYIGNGRVAVGAGKTSTGVFVWPVRGEQ
jgi:hypothetical protein